MRNDLRYACRTLLRSPGFTLVAALTLALGIGANSALFSVVNALLLRPLAYRDPGRIVVVWQNWPQRGFPRLPAFNPEYTDLRANSRTLDEVAAFHNEAWNLTGGGEPERIAGANASASLFRLLGVAPLLGRTFSEAEDRPGANRVAVLGYGLWKRRFGADPRVLGRSLVLDGAAYSIIGVMPERFRFSLGVNISALDFPKTELWLPLAFTPQQAASYDSADLQILARLKGGVTLAQAQAETAARHAARMRREGLELGMGIQLAPLAGEVVGDIRPALLILLGAVGCVLLIACTNLGNLLLARGAARQREIAIRAALGAGRAALVRQLLAEGLLLALAGGALGLLLAVPGTRALVALSPADLSRANDIGIDAHVLAFTFALAALSALLFGLAPALKLAAGDIHEHLKESGRGVAGSLRHARLRSALVVSEIALALVLTISAALLIGSFLRVKGVDPGFQRERILTANIPLSPSKYGQPARRAQFFEQVLGELKRLPGATAAGLITHLPLGDSSEVFFTIEGHPTPKLADTPMASRRSASEGYFRAMGIPLLRGRLLNDGDREGAPPVALIDELAAQRYWPGEDPLGKGFKIGAGSGLAKRPWIRIVGVAGNIRQYAMDEAARPGMYLSYLQDPRAEMSLVVRSAGDPRALISAVRGAVRAVDADQPVAHIRTMEQAVEKSVSQRSFNSTLLGVFAGVALALALLGIYGVIAWSVNQRTHEIGLRMALGARPGDVLGLVVGQGMLLAGTGIGLGVAGALAATRVLRTLLYGISATDPLTFAAVPLLLAAVAALAAWLPARRAARVDPVVALRHE